MQVRDIFTDFDNFGDKRVGDVSAWNIYLIWLIDSEEMFEDVAKGDGHSEFVVPTLQQNKYLQKMGYRQ